MTAELLTVVAGHDGLRELQRCSLGDVARDLSFSPGWRGTSTLHCGCRAMPFYLLDIPSAPLQDILKDCAYRPLAVKDQRQSCKLVQGSQLEGYTASKLAA